MATSDLPVDGNDAAVGQVRSTSTPTLPRPAISRSPHSNPIFSSLPPLTTSAGARNLRQKTPLVNSRLSTLSTISVPSFLSRPQSFAFPHFHSSLSYTLVRDFAYPPHHASHYGPALEGSTSATTPRSEFNRRLSDPPSLWPVSRGTWDTDDPNARLPSASFGDGPPFGEDDDLHSPIVKPAKHKKSRSDQLDYEFYDRDRPRSTSSESSATTQGRSRSRNNAQNRMEDVEEEDENSEVDTSYFTYRQQYSYEPDEENSGFEDDDDDDDDDEESRFSRSYEFTIASPDEEMHGKAVALFDFMRENDNELPLIEGQVVLISYRHGEGWLVAQDPRTGESGLVPEAYVRLLRDIEGGLDGLQGLDSSVTEYDEGLTPTATSHVRSHSGLSGKHYAPIVSQFSTSSKDFEPYPHQLLSSPGNAPVVTTDAADAVPQEGVKLDQPQKPA